MSATVLITGATGNVGQAVIKLLKDDANIQVRAGVRDPANEKAKSLGVPLVQVDPKKPETLDAAFKGVDRLYINTPSAEDRTELTNAQLDAAKRNGISTVVVLSFFTICMPEPEVNNLLFNRQLIAVEKYAKSIGVAATFIRSPMFKDNIWGQAASIKKDGVFYGGQDPDAKQNFVAVADLARLIASILKSPAGHAGKVYESTGGDVYSLNDTAALLSKALGREVKYVQVPYDANYQSLLAFFPAWQAAGVIELNKAADAGIYNRVSNDIKEITGTAPATEQEFVAGFAAAL